MNNTETARSRRYQVRLHVIQGRYGSTPEYGVPTRYFCPMYLYTKIPAFPISRGTCSGVPERNYNRRE